MHVDAEKIQELVDLRVRAKKRFVMANNGISEKLEANSTYCNNRLPEKIPLYNPSLCGKVTEVARSLQHQLLGTTETHQPQKD